MRINRELFFSEYDELFGPLRAGARARLNQILGFVEKYAGEFSSLRNPYQTAYILSTFEGETGDYAPKREGAPRGTRNQVAYFEGLYGYKTRKGKDLGNREAGDGFEYRGNGLVQNTGYDVHRKLSRALGVDLVASPELLGDIELSFRAGVYGMETGLYTNRKLSQFISADGKKLEYKEARAIVNPGELKPTVGLVHKRQLKRITDNAQNFLTCLLASIDDEDAAAVDRSSDSPAPERALDPVTPLADSGEVGRQAPTNSPAPPAAESASMLDRLSKAVSNPDSPAIQIAEKHSDKLTKSTIAGNFFAGVGAWINGHQVLAIILAIAATLIVLAIIYRDWLTTKLAATLNTDPDRHNMQFVRF